MLFSFGSSQNKHLKSFLFVLAPSSTLFHPHSAVTEGCFFSVVISAPTGLGQLHFGLRTEHFSSLTSVFHGGFCWRYSEANQEEHHEELVLQAPCILLPPAGSCTVSCCSSPSEGSCMCHLRALAFTSYKGSSVFC